MAAVELDSYNPPRAHWKDDTPESSPLVSPDAPVFPVHSESDPKLTKQSVELVVPHILLPSAPIEEPHRQQEVYRNPCTELYSNPAWQSYRNAREARRSKHWTPTRSGSRASPFPTPGHSISLASLRVDTATANGTMGVSSRKDGGPATGATGQWRPTPVPMSRSRSPARLNSQPNPATKTPPGYAPINADSAETQHVSGRGQNWSPFRRRNDSLFAAIQSAVHKVEKFEGVNYPSWSYWFQRKVAGVPGHNIWGHISGLHPRPTESSIMWDQEAGYGMDPIERWDMDEAAIYCALLSVISSTVARGQVEGCTTAKQVWDRLELLYGDLDAPATRAANIIRELSQITYTPGDDLRTHLRGIKRLVDQLQEGPHRIPESLALWFIYDSMPGCFTAEVRELRKEDLSMSSAIERLEEIGDKVLGGQSKARGIEYRQTVTRGGPLPLDLRHYKYHGNGEASDGQLYQRAQKTCLACLGTGHKAYSKECPQTEVRLGLWGKQSGPIVVESCNFGIRPLTNLDLAFRPSPSRPLRWSVRLALGRAVDQGWLPRVPTGARFEGA